MRNSKTLTKENPKPENGKRVIKEKKKEGERERDDDGEGVKTDKKKKQV